MHFYDVNEICVGVMRLKVVINGMRLGLLTSSDCRMSLRGENVTSVEQIRRKRSAGLKRMAFFSI